MMVTELQPGTVVGGEFRVVRPLSAGGMGAVYVAEQLSTGQLRALKVMHPALVQEPRLRDRFAQEARVGSHIASEHVVQVIGAGVDPALGIPWLAMELLEGQDLARWATVSLTLNEVLRIFRPLCHALGAAHAAGVVHRDIKPENVFLANARSADTATHVKVLDFGIAKLAAEAKDTSTATIGTPLWMAPEQSDPRAVITPAADVWALGLLAFRLLFARHYFRAANDPQGSLQAVMRESLVEPLVPASQRAAEYGLSALVPPGFDVWFARCVNREPTARFATATEVLAGLEHVAAPAVDTRPSAGVALAASNPPSPPPKKRSSGRWIFALLALAVVGIGAVAAVGGVWMFQDELFGGGAKPASPSAAVASALAPASSAAAPVPSAEVVETPTGSPQEKAKVATVATGVGKAVSPAQPTATASAAVAPSATAAATKGPFNQALAEQRLRAAESQAASQCKAKKTGSAPESFKGFKAFHPSGKGGLIMQGAGGSSSCVRGIISAVSVPPYDAPEWDAKQLPFSVTVP